MKQPWANLIASGQKTIETRTWATIYRGPLLIVSSKRPNIEPTGSAVAIADLVDCHLMKRTDESAACCAVYPNSVSWVLENVRRVRAVLLEGRTRSVRLPGKPSRPAFHVICRQKSRQKELGLLRVKSSVVRHRPFPVGCQAGQGSERIQGEDADDRVSWSHIVGQLGSAVKVYSGS